MIIKQYLTRAQMRELAEIGIDTRALATHECTENGITYFSLSIGDLIGMLPKEIEPANGYRGWLEIGAVPMSRQCFVLYRNSCLDVSCYADELIDALFRMLIRLKKECMI